MLLTYLPFPATEQHQKDANYIYDANSHLNPSGARKRSFIIYKLYLNATEYLTGNLDDDTGLNIISRRGDTVVDNVRFVHTVDFEMFEVNVTETNRD